MKTVNIEQTTLDGCVADAQQERIVVTRNGVPVALVVGVDGLDAEQLELGASDEFWELISERRKQPVITRDELNNRLNSNVAE